ncbi:S-layer homology domain-containing protein [Alkalihalophilus marmarensis]|uniref:SLH domain-containing protein n=1 Tax=Alkalihalophilus marmarensis DSM 21297 TaxID=1188261 RepID=U6SKY1_9BACI|nr:S-layer homology domain-containing protein [Alkalihalophilus marmarensis]ERN52042.1 hypothetical protein A33I_18285 [Alkalihalophilus marmarensis DSM 21297]
MNIVKSVMITLLFVIVGPLTVKAESFTDVSPTHWGKEEIEYLFKEGVIQGTGNGNFSPNAPVTRAQVAVMLMRAMDLEGASAPPPPFNDVHPDTFGYKAIGVLTDKGVFSINGTYSGRFEPERATTRVEMAAVLARAYDLTGENLFPFPDVDPRHWGHEEIRAIAYNGVMAGNTRAQFLPEQTMTRAEFSVSLARVLNSDLTVDADQIIEQSIINQTEHNIRELSRVFFSAVFHNDPCRPYSEVRPLLSPYASATYSFGHLYRNYQEKCEERNGQLYYGYHAFDLRSEASVSGRNTVQVTTISLPNSIFQAKHWTFTLKADEGVYKIDHSAYEMAEERSFELTKIESEKILEEHYPGSDIYYHHTEEHGTFEQYVYEIISPDWGYFIARIDNKEGHVTAY